MRGIGLLEAEHPPVDALHERPCEFIARRTEQVVREGRRRGAVLGRVEVDDLLLPLARVLDAHAAEVLRVFGAGLLRQVGVVLAEERGRGRLGEALRRAERRRAEEVRLRVAEVAAGRGEERARECGPRLVFLHELADAPVVDVHRVRPEVDRELALHAQDVAEAHAPVVGKRIRREQLLHEALAVPRANERLRLLDGRDASRQVEVESPHEHSGRGVTKHGLPRGIGRTRRPHLAILRRSSKERQARKGRRAADERAARHVVISSRFCHGTIKALNRDFLVTCMSQIAL